MQKSMKDYYVYCLTTGYALFRGRARRREFWLFALASFLVSLILTVIEKTLLGGSDWLTTLYFIVVLVPTLAVGARRLHDIDRTGWWQLFLIVPIVGWIVIVAFACITGQPGENRFGPDPKADLTARSGPNPDSPAG
ncbi:MAG: DUF805 domain-containing protein [Tagaea sp.]